MSVYLVCFWCLWRPEKGIGCPGTGNADGCEAPYGCWKSNPGPLEDHSCSWARLTTSSCSSSNSLLEVTSPSEIEAKKINYHTSRIKANYLLTLWSRCHFPLELSLSSLFQIPFH
uniref:Uncharacterized protein n=1 Tax=Mus musculus TaxID=10090 RepID=Q9D8K6_MOUSE|nr:unnamed protein product [Mus musculus]